VRLVRPSRPTFNGVSNTPIVQLHGVSKRFDATDALTATDLSIAPGSFVSIVGPSGCGKSTLFNIISGLTAPTSGSVVVDGRDVTGSAGHVGYMLQKDLLVPWRTVVGNITLGSALRGGVTQEDVEEAVAIASKYGLGEFLDHYPAALSGGMRQRVAFMRTLASRHQVLLLDEPFGALDAQTRFAMQEWLLEVWRDTGRTVLFITHDVDEALFLSDRVLVMSPRPGRIVDDFAVELERPRSLETLTEPRFMELKQRVLRHLHDRGEG
jgi:ABC-type nitrate/sulfonate/bicarbonate transport system ATPase subunit